MLRNTRRSLLYLFALLAPLFLATSLFSQRDLYWTEFQTGGNAVIMGADIDGQNAVPIFTGTEMVSYAVDIALTSEHMYWTGHNGGDIWRANLDGSEAARIVEQSAGLLTLHNLVVDEVAGKIYVADHGVDPAETPGGIYSVNIDGTGLQNLWTTSPWFYTGIALRNSNQLLWFTRSSDFLFLQSTSGGQPEARQLSGAGQIYGLAYVPATDTVYYTNYTSGTLRSYNLTTNVDQLILGGLTSPLGVKLSPGGTHLIIVERGVGISAYQLDNFGYGLLVAAPNAHFGVAVTADPADLPPGEPPPEPAEEGDIIFQADFEDEEPGTLPRTVAQGGHWGRVDTPAVGTASVVVDENNVFGFGANNRFLRFSNGNGFTLSSTFESVGVATLSFDMIRRYYTEDGETGRWINISLNASGGRANLLSLRNNNSQIRTYAADHASWPTPLGFTGPVNPSAGVHHQPIRLSFVVNNSEETITYTGPDETEHQLSPAHASLWAYQYRTGAWEHVFPEYTYERQAGGFIESVVFQIDSNPPLRSFDFDNISVIKGAAIPEPAELEFPRFVDADFENIPQGSITTANWGKYIHGNFTRMAFNSTYGDPVVEEQPTLLRIVADTEDRFGKGPENQILRASGARGWQIHSENTINEEVVTLRFDMIHDDRIGGGRLTPRFLDAEGLVLSRLELDSSFADNGGFRNDLPGTWSYGEVHRFEQVLNNSTEPLQYTTPSGGSRTLIPGGTDLWIDGELAFGNSLDGRTSEAGVPITTFQILTFSSNPWNGDFDVIRVMPGVQLVPVGSEPSGEFAAWLEEHFPGVTDPAIIGGAADPDGDGVSNLVEFALGMDPNAASREGLPVLGEVEIEGKFYLTLTGTLPDGTNLDLAVEATSDLGDWSNPDLGVPVSGSPNGDGTTTYTFRDVIPIDEAEGGRRFLRLSVAEKTD